MYILIIIWCFNIYSMICKFISIEDIIYTMDEREI